jgi:hypothetical protein
MNEMRRLAVRFGGMLSLVCVTACTSPAPPVAEGTTPVTTTLERDTEVTDREAAEAPSEGLPDAGGAAEPVEEPAVVDGTEPTEPAWFERGSIERDGRVVAGASAESNDLREARRRALASARASLARAVGEETALAATVDRGAVYPTETGFRVYVLCSVAPPAPEDGDETDG